MFNPYVVPLVVEGEEFAFYVGNEEGKAWYDTPESSRRAEMRFIREHLVTPGGLVVECGCHHGLTTILLSKWVGPHGKVLAFEANAKNAAIALENVILNGLTNVEIHVAAVGNVTGTLFLMGEFNSSVCSASVPGSTEVAAIRLDDFLGGRIPDLAKIDVEGYETEVLRGFRSTLAPGRSNLAIEVHTQELVSYGSSSTELFELATTFCSSCWLGIGSQANQLIWQRRVYQDRLPEVSRFYLFVTSGRSAMQRFAPACGG